MRNNHFAFVAAVLAFSLAALVAPGLASADSKPAPTARVNVNTATVEQLTLLPGVGPSKAERVIAWRTKNGDFKRVADLRKVKGFGAKKLEKLKGFLTTSGPTTVAVKKVKVEAKPEPAPALQGRRPPAR